MSITWIAEVQAKPELSEVLRDFLISIMPMIKSSEGCEAEIHAWLRKTDRSLPILFSNNGLK